MALQMYWVSDFRVILVLAGHINAWQRSCRHSSGTYGCTRVLRDACGRIASRGEWSADNVGRFLVQA